jgi:transcriptional regulator with XRE-family HTH domain
MPDQVVSYPFTSANTAATHAIMRVIMSRPAARSRDARAYLGSRLREARIRQEIGVRELARRIGVSPAHISQIETGKADPSATTLFAIASELGLSLSEIAFVAPERPGVTTNNVAPPSGTPDGVVQHPTDRPRIDLESGVSWERLTPTADPNIDFMYLVYGPGGESTPANALLRHDGQEYGYILSGRLEVTIGFTTHKLGPGDSIAFECTTPHRFANVEDEPVHAIWFVVNRLEPAAP